MRARNIEVALRWVGPAERAAFLDGTHGAARQQILAIAGLVAAELGIEGLVLIGHLLSRRRLGVLGRNGAAFFRRIDTRGHVGEVARAVAELVLYRERRQSTKATSSLVGLFEALGQQPSLERKSVKRRERRGHLACARAGEVGQRQAGHAGARQVGDVVVHVGVVAARRVEGLRAELEATGAIRVVRHGGGKRLQHSARVSHGSGWALVGRWR